jgi:penicillin-binding protein 1A
LVEALITGCTEGQVELMVGRDRAIIPLRETGWQPPSNAPSSRRRRWSREVPVGYVAMARVVAAGDPLTLTLVRKPTIEAALVAIDPLSRHVKALVGGYDYALSQFNRATKSRRPPGSAMKPFVYSAAFSTKEWTPSSIIVDNATPIGLEEGGYWKPRNYSGGYYGPTSLHYALVNSRNVVTAKLAYRIGIQAVIDRAHLLGLSEDFPPALSISLGAFGVSLLEMVNAYATFAAMGAYQKPVLITHVMDRNGQVIYGRPTMPEQVLSPGEAYQMTYILNKVTTSGTATRALALGRRSAGKTGTTSDFRDSWYVGYVPQLVAGVWVGRDDFRPMAYGMTGSKGGLPIWLDFMRHVLADTPKLWFEQPDDVYFRYGLCFLEGTKATPPAMGAGGTSEIEAPGEAPATLPGTTAQGEDAAVAEALSQTGNYGERLSEAPGPLSDSVAPDGTASRGQTPSEKKTELRKGPASADQDSLSTSTVASDHPKETNTASDEPPADEEPKSRREKLRDFFTTSTSNDSSHDSYASDGHY